MERKSGSSDDQSLSSQVGGMSLQEGSQQSTSSRRSRPSKWARIHTAGYGATNVPDDPLSQRITRIRHHSDRYATAILAPSARSVTTTRPILQKEEGKRKSLGYLPGFGIKRRPTGSILLDQQDPGEVRRIVGEGNPLAVSQRQDFKRLGHLNRSGSVNSSNFLRRRGSFSGIGTSITPRHYEVYDAEFVVRLNMVLKQTQRVTCDPSKVEEIIEKKFRIMKQQLLGSGAFGQVYACHKVGETERLAIKTFQASFPPPLTINDLTKDGSREEIVMKPENIREKNKEHRRALILSLHEIIVMRSLENHPYIIRYENHFIINDMIYILMELGDDTLEHQIELYPEGMPENKARKWFYEIAQGISYMHTIGIAHRDIKTDNFMIKRLRDNTTLCKIMDFGKSQFMPRESRENIDDEEKPIRSDRKFGTVRTKTIVGGTKTSDPGIQRLRDVMKLPGLVDQRHLIMKRKNRSQLILEDLYCLGSTLALMLHQDYAIELASQLPREMFMFEDMKVAKEQLSDHGKDLIWRLLQEDGSGRITTIKQKKKLGEEEDYDEEEEEPMRILVKHPWLLLPGKEPRFRTMKPGGRKDTGYDSPT